MVIVLNVKLVSILHWEVLLHVNNVVLLHGLKQVHLHAKLALDVRHVLEVRENVVDVMLDMDMTQQHNHVHHVGQ